MTRPSSKHMVTPMTGCHHSWYLQWNSLNDVLRVVVSQHFLAKIALNFASKRIAGTKILQARTRGRSAQGCTWGACWPRALRPKNTYFRKIYLTSPINAFS